MTTNSTPTSASPNALIPLLRRVYTLLQRCQPLVESTDPVWAGPWFIPRPNRWYPTWFQLYRGALHGTLEVGRSSRFAVEWRIATGEVALPQAESFSEPFENGETLWQSVLARVEQQLTWGLENPERYNRHVERHLPLERRTGRIQRRWTWPAGSDTALPPSELDAFARALARLSTHPRRSAMSRARFLADAAIAYGAAYEDLKALTPLQRYERRADRRHGGLLDLDETDEKAFESWFDGHRWMGAHPWEIVFGHPHGIHLYPSHHEDGWSYTLAVSEERLHAQAALMVVALETEGVPVEFPAGAGVLSALSGEDNVRVGSSESVRFEELREGRPGATEAVRWDPIPQLALITEEEAARVRIAEAGEVPPARPRP